MIESNDFLIIMRVIYTIIINWESKDPTMWLCFKDQKIKTIDQNDKKNTSNPINKTSWQKVKTKRKNVNPRQYNMIPKKIIHHINLKNVSSFKFINSQLSEVNEMEQEKNGK